MPSVGEKIRKARLAQGWDLERVSLQTKIHRRYLTAIEADDRGSLPAGFFYKNWVRQYADSLGIDSAALLSEVDHAIAGDAPPVLPGQERRRLPRDMRPAPLNMSGQPMGWNRGIYSVVALVAVVLGCSGFYAWWRTTQVQQVTSDASSTPPSVVAAASSVTPEKAPPPKVAEPPVEQQADRATPPPEPSGDVQIELSAIEQTWISITPDGKETFSGVIRPPEVRTVAAHESAKIRFGNAGGVSVRLNGKPIGPIGTSGQVRTLIINKSGFRILETKPPGSETDAPPLANRATLSPLNEQ